MKFKALALLGFILALPAVCSAQAVKSGTWTGTVTPPGETQPIPITFDVVVNGDSLGVVIHVGEHGDFTTEKGRYADDTITFTFNPPEVVVTCTLAKNEEGAFAGPCIGDDGSDASMTMIPPKE